MRPTSSRCPTRMRSARGRWDSMSRVPVDTGRSWARLMAGTKKAWGAGSSPAPWIGISGSRLSLSTPPRLRIHKPADLQIGSSYEQCRPANDMTLMRQSICPRTVKSRETSGRQTLPNPKFFSGHRSTGVVGTLVCSGHPAFIEPKASEVYRPRPGQQFTCLRASGGRRPASAARQPRYTSVSRRPMRYWP